MGAELNHADDKSHPVVTGSTEKDMTENTMQCVPGGTDVMPLDSSENEEMEKLHKVETTMQNETYVYRQDVVRCINREDMLGVVLEVPGDSDSEDSVTDSSDNDDEENDNAVESDHGNEAAGGGDKGEETKDESDSGDEEYQLSIGEVRIMWLDGTETTNNLRDLTVVDRSFLHGDIVASTSNPTGQLGLVVNVQITVDLLSPTGKLIKHVSATELTRIRKLAIGDYVVQGPWLGRVDDVLDNVTVLFDDGSVCKVLKADPSRLKPLCRNTAYDSDFPYYPGQRVRASSSSVFKSCRFLSGLWKANRLEGTVTKVEAGSVSVYWTSSSSIDTGANSSAIPSEQQNPKNLTLVSCFEYANWQLGDWCLYLPHSGTLSSSCGTSQITEVSTENCNQKDTRCKNVEVSQHENAAYNYEDKTIGGLEIGEQGSDCNTSEDFDQGEECDADELQNIHNYSDSYTMSDCCRDSLNELKLEENCPRQDCIGKDNSTEIGNSAPSGQKESIRERLRKKLRKVFVKKETKGHHKDESFEKAFLIGNSITKVDVAWQDGSREVGINSTSLIPINSAGVQEFFPEMYVVEKPSNESDDFSETNRVGVVRSVNATERTACVRWLKSVSKPEDPREFEVEEVVSVYELDGHTDYDYSYGDVVIRLSPIALAGDAPNGNSVEEVNDLTIPTQENGANYRHPGSSAEKPSNDETGDTVDLSWVGHITGLQDGDIEVTWADGMISKVGPQAIFVVGRDDDETLGGSEDGDAASWETVEENEMGHLDLVEEGSDMAPQPENNGDETSEEDENSNVAKGGALSSALGLVTRLASGIFSRGQKQTDESFNEESKLGSHELLTSEDVTQPGNLNHEKSGTIADTDGVQTCGASTINESECQLLAETSNAEMTTSNNSEKYTLDDAGTESNGIKENGFYFKHFDITTNPLDHYFIGETGQAIGERKWAKKVQQEWGILEKNLPDAIYVRVFEDRIDLLRAAIIGACGTPYQDGLFFFDFQLPPEYPGGPPKTYYHSGGLRLNPNLYEDGKVCLSLLNTWTGKGNEVWDPSSSSILQVLVSLQGLVLNSKPYFNEAGYERQIGTVEGEKNCLPYNENTFLLNLKSMMYLLRRPPMHFEDFTKDHFRGRGHYILKACDAYMKGSKVGSLTRDADMTEESKKHSCSVGFRLMLAKILPRLFTALKEIGAECSQYEHLLKS